MFAGCAKEEFPQSSTVTGDQAATSLMAQVAGLHSWMNKWNVLGSENHWDIGYSALIISREYMGQDYTQRIQYNQWGSWINITGQNKDTTVTQFPWRWYYRLIFTTNSIIAAVEDPANATDPNNKWAVGIAYTYRAMAYLDLGRLYLQGRYTANSSGATVPIVKDGMTLEDTFNNPRVPATELYKFIVEDLETAATLLADYERSEAEVPDASVPVNVPTTT